MNSVPWFAILLLLKCLKLLISFTFASYLASRMLQFYLLLTRVESRRCLISKSQVLEWRHRGAYPAQVNDGWWLTPVAGPCWSEELRGFVNHLCQVFLIWNMHVIFNQGTFTLVCKEDFIKYHLVLHCCLNHWIFNCLLRLPFFQEYFAISHVVLMSASPRYNYNQYYSPNEKCLLKFLFAKFA